MQWHRMCIRCPHIHLPTAHHTLTCSLYLSWHHWQVIICPLERLISKTDASLEEIGPPEGLIGSFGPYITGTNVEEEEVLSATAKKIGGRTYYDYEVFAPYGTQPPHGLASLTTKGDAAILFVVNATEKQWANSKDKLKSVVDSFVV